MFGLATLVTGSGIVVSILTVLITVYIWKRSCKRIEEERREKRMGQTTSTSISSKKESNVEANLIAQRSVSRYRSSSNSRPSTPVHDAVADWKKICETMSDEKMKLMQQVNTLLIHDQEMKSVIAEYEKTMQLVIENKAAEIDDDEKEVLAKEKDLALEDLENVELAFSDLHRRYEKTKSIIEAMKKNEDTLKSCLSDCQRKHKFQDDRYQALKDHVSEKLEKANKELEVVRRRAENDVIVLKASLKKSELTIESLQNSLEQKKRENLELTSICEELLSKMGPKV